MALALAGGIEVVGEPAHLRAILVLSFFGNCTILTGLPAYAEAEADTRGTCRGIDTDRFRALRRGALS